MAMPHKIFKKKAFEEFKNLKGKGKINKIKEIIKDMPNYNNGPYGDIRKELKEEIKKTKTRSSIKNKSIFDIKKQGDLQVIFIGKPSVGKSSIISKLTNKKIKTAAYDFTTIKPEAATFIYNSLHIQLVDLPGLIEDASKGKGIGKQILSCAHNGDMYILVHDITIPFSESLKILKELGNTGMSQSNINYKSNLIIVVNKVDLINKNINSNIRKHFPNAPIMYLSIHNKEKLKKLKDLIFKESGYISIISKLDNSIIPLHKDNSTTEDLCNKIHTDLKKKFKYAKVTGPSSKFPNQKLGLDHILKDKDEVEIIKKI